MYDPDNPFEGMNPVYIIKRQCDVIIKLNKQDTSLREVGQFFKGKFDESSDYVKACNECHKKHEEAKALLIDMCSKLSKYSNTF